MEKTYNFICDDSCGMEHLDCPAGHKCNRCGKILDPLTTKTDPKATLRFQCGVMARAFREACQEKFERKAKENNRTLEPWKDEPINYLRDRLEEEKDELFDAMFDGDPEAIMDECLDVANFAWFIYENAKARLKTGP